jgi:hypothetical protein
MPFIKGLIKKIFRLKNSNLIADWYETGEKYQRAIKKYLK